jgi:hypothetical protein
MSGVVGQASAQLGLKRRDEQAVFNERAASGIEETRNSGIRINHLQPLTIPIPRGCNPPPSVVGTRPLLLGIGLDSQSDGFLPFSWQRFQDGDDGQELMPISRSLENETPVTTCP